MASAWLAALGDKRFLFSESGRSFIMYARAGPQLDRHGRAGRPGRRAAGAALALSRALRRLGRPGRVLRGRPRRHARPGRARPHLLQAGRAGLRAARRLRPDRLGPVRPAPGAAAGAARRRHVRGPAARRRRRAAARAAAVSDGWLASKHAREKRFSLGHFEPGYLRRFPLAMVRKGASSWRSPIYGPRPITASCRST